MQSWNPKNSLRVIFNPQDSLAEILSQRLAKDWSNVSNHFSTLTKIAILNIAADF